MKIKEKIFFKVLFFFVTLFTISIFYQNIFPQSVYNKIALSRQESVNDWDIWMMNREGTNQVKLVDNTYRDTGPCFNPQGTKIVFARVFSQMPMQSDVFVMNSDGTNEINLTNTPQLTGPALSPKFSWDGTKIVFDVANTPGNTDIYLMNSDGTGVVGIVTESGDDSSPHLSPDGQWVVFMRQISMFPDPKAKICKKLVSGGSVIDLTNGNNLDETPTFSDDGNYIIFKRGFTQWDLYKMPSNHNPNIDTDLVNLSNQSTWAMGTAMYSWEGDKIVYYTSPSGPDSAEIWMMNPDGTGKQRITYNNVADFDPTFSPKLPVINNHLGSVINNFHLYQNEPNPFNPSTKIRFDIAHVKEYSQYNIRLVIYDITGRAVAILFDGALQAGTYSVKWNASEFSSGIYFLKLESEKFSDTKKMLFIK